MNVAGRLAGFAVVVALVFAGAAFAGSRLDVHPGKTTDRSPAWARMAAMAPQPVRGLAVSEKGLTLELARRTAPQGKPFELAFRIVDRRGQTVRDFDVEHTKRMHFIVVRRDMTGFQHLHPTETPTAPGRSPSRSPTRAPTACSPTSPSARSPTRSPTTSPSTAPCAPRRCPRPPSAVDVDGLRVAPHRGRDQGRRGVGAGVHRHPRRPAGRHPGLPGRQGPPRGAAPGRPRLPARAPRREPPAVHGDVPDRGHATACSCSSRPPTAACTPPRSPRR